MKRIHSISATCVTTQTRWIPKKSGMWRTIKLNIERPNRYRVETGVGAWGSRDAKPEILANYQTVVGDGVKAWRIHPGMREYQSLSPRKPMQGVVLWGVTPLDGFFDGLDFGPALREFEEEGLLKRVSLEDLPQGTKKVEIVHQVIGGKTIETDSYRIEKDLLIHRTETTMSDGSRKFSSELKDIRIDQSIDPRLFAYSIRADFKPEIYTELASNGLQPGSMAPDFAITDTSGKSVKLEDFRGKTVVLDFWATWCENCVQQMPSTSRFARDYKDRGVVVLEVDAGDSPKVFQAWMKKKTGLDDLQFLLDAKGISGEGIDKVYKVGALPTQVVIDRDGKVVTSIVGNDGAADQRLEDAVQKLLSQAGNPGS